MLVTKATLSPNTKVWVYQSDRPFTQHELEIIDIKVGSFVNQWDSHGNAVKGAYSVVDNQFIVLFSDLSFNEVSGCSIDKSVGVMRELSSDFKIDLLDKGKVAYKSGTSIRVIDFKQIKSVVAAGDINAETMVFDNSVATLEEYDTRWITTAKSTWLNRYFNSSNN
jgi:hypothetical protein